MKTWLVMLAAALLAAPGALAAQDAADPHEQVYDVMQAGIDDEVMLDRRLAQARAEFAKWPKVIELERRRPGALDEVMAVIRPIVREQSDRVEAEYRPRMIAVLRAGLSRREAAEVAEFYASPLGQKVLTANSRNSTSSSVMNAAFRDGEVSAANVETDAQATGRAVFDSLSQAEQAQLFRELAARPGLAKLTPLVSRLAPLRAEMESEMLNEEEQARLNAALEDAFGSGN